MYMISSTNISQENDIIDDTNQRLIDIIRKNNEKMAAKSPLEFKEISIITLYPNLQVGIDKDFPCLRSANQNHVYPFSMLAELVNNHILTCEQVRIVQSVDRKLWIAREGVPNNVIATHSAMARVPDPSDPKKYIMNNYALFAGNFSFTVVSDELTGLPRIHIYEFTNRSGGFRSQFNDMQIMLISMLEELSHLPSVSFAPEIVFHMEEFFLLSIENRTTRSFICSDQQLVSMLTHLNVTYQKTIFAPELLATYAAMVLPTTITEVEDYAEYKALLKAKGGTSTRIVPKNNPTTHSPERDTFAVPKVRPEILGDITMKFNISTGIKSAGPFFRPPPTPIHNKTNSSLSTANEPTSSKRKHRDILNKVNKHVALQAELDALCEEKIENLAEASANENRDNSIETSNIDFEPVRKLAF